MGGTEPDGDEPDEPSDNPISDETEPDAGGVVAHDDGTRSKSLVDLTPALKALVTAADFAPKFNAADLVASMSPLVTAADFAPKFNAADLVASMSPLVTAADFAPKFNAADLVASMSPLVTAADFMPKFNAASLTAAMARSITSDLLKVGVRYSLEDGVAAVARRASVLDVEELHRLVGAARAAGPDSVPTDEVIQSVVSKAVYAVPPPVDERGLLVDDPALVSSWVAALMARALAATGLSERDLKEDAVAAYVYLLVGSIVFALLLNLPVFAALGGMLGVAAHPPAKVAAKVSRTVYRQLHG